MEFTHNHIQIAREQAILKNTTIGNVNALSLISDD